MIQLVLHILRMLLVREWRARRLGWVCMKMGRIGGFALRMRRMVLAVAVVGRIAPCWEEVVTSKKERKRCVCWQ